MGIKGIVRDALTNEPLEGVFVYVHGISHITISDNRGEYFRLLPAGAYKVTFELSEYKNRTIRVLVDNLMNQANPFDVKMDRELEEIKLPAVLAAKEQEARNCLNQTFSGDYKEIGRDFHSLPVFKYHSYDEMLGFMFYYQEKYPKITYMYKIEDKNIAKRAPFVMVISTNPESHSLLKPEFKYSANSFGDDWVGKELLLLLIKHLLESYGKDDEITRLINSTRIHIVPSIDPESFEKEYERYKLEIANQNTTTQKMKNSLCNPDEIAPNLDLIYPDARMDRQTYVTDRFRFTKWMDEMSFVLSGSLYDGQLLARLPYNTLAFNENSTRTQEDELFHYLAASYVQVSN